MRIRSFGLAAAFLAACSPATSEDEGGVAASQAVPANVSVSNSSPVLPEVNEADAVRNAAAALGFPPESIPGLGTLVVQDDLPSELGTDVQGVLDILATFEPREVTIDRYGMPKTTPYPTDKWPQMWLLHTSVIARSKKTNVPTDLYVLILKKMNPDGSRTFVALSGPLIKFKFEVVPEDTPPPRVT